MTSSRSDPRKAIELQMNDDSIRKILSYGDKQRPRNRIHASV
jgi:hypothetical protein